MSEVFRVAEPGLFTTIQDIGRPQAIASGVPPGGAMDRFAHTAANFLVGNDRAAPTLECTLIGPHLVALRGCLIAIAGADLDARINGEPAPMWTGFSVQEGDELTFGRRRSGARAYIAIGGGVIGDRWLGSMSTYVMAGRGGMHGRALRSGDVISAAEPLYSAAPGSRLAEHLLPPYTDHTLHTMAGPHVNRLLPESRDALFGEFSVSPNSNRMGYRLEGARLEAPGEELLSFGLIAGVVQLPSGGQPILLMADHQTAGGYPVVATVLSASMPVAAQLAPGDELRFVEASIESALEMRSAQRAALDSII